MVLLPDAAIVCSGATLGVLSRQISPTPSA
jgi:hypothetical protein